MSAKSNKRRVSKLFFRRFHGKVLWQSAEDRAWDNMVPVGREFGSPDYERLNILDMYSWGCCRRRQFEQVCRFQLIRGNCAVTRKKIEISSSAAWSLISGVPGQIGFGRYRP